MNEKVTVVCISILFSVLMIALFYVQHIIAPNMNKRYYRLGVMVIIAFLNFLIMDSFDALIPLNIFGPTCAALLFIISTVGLFIGPIFQNYLNDLHAESRIPDKAKYREIKRKQRIQNFPYMDVIIAPIIEEVLYRYCNGNLWMSVGISNSKIIFCSPLIFGLAHFHHFFETEDLAKYWKRALLTCIIQVGFTSLFGFWNQFCWVKTRGILTCIILHSFCNYMQFPNFKEAINWPFIQERRRLYTAYIAGIIIFCVLTLILVKL